MKKLKQLEKIISSNIKKPFEVGRALREIRDSRLYKQEHENFKQYVENKWGITKSGAYQKIKCADIHDIIPEIQNESQAAELCRLGKSKRNIKSIWNQDQKQNKPITQRLLKKLIDKKLGITKMDWYDQKVESFKSLKKRLVILDAPDDMIDQISLVIDLMEKLKTKCLT